MNGNQHVVPHEGGWAVRAENRTRVTAIYRTQREAIAAARIIARIRGGELLVHARSGRIRRRDSTGGRDPYPPKG
jgi:uncharacterized protein DUF2188